MSESYLTPLSSLKQHIANFYPQAAKALAAGDAGGADLAAVLNNFHEAMQGTCADSKDIPGDLEVSFREVLQQHLLSIQNHDNGAGESNSITADDCSVWALVALAMEFAKSFSGTKFLVQRVPFKMLEDVLETLTIAQAEQVWPRVEALALNITSNDELFSKGNFSVLKMCNSLLRKLSKSCNTEFCGTVLMFLASIYPISEKSAVNIPGKINSSNSTYYEDAASFAESARVAMTARSDVEPADAVPAATGDGAEAKQQEIPALMNEISYEMYQSFWQLQSFFASESKVIESVDVWRKFIVSTNDVIKLFRLKDYSEQELQQANSSLTHAAGNDAEDVTVTGPAPSIVSSASGYLGSKFLTSSQLFALQLRDPLLRQQICVQILYFIHYLRAKALPFTETAAVTEVAKDMLRLHDEAKAIIEHTPGDGAKFVAVIKRLLSREKHWIAWKNAGCKNFQRSPKPISTTVSEEEIDQEEFLGQLKEQSSNSLKIYSKRHKGKPGAGTDVCKISSSFIFDNSDGHVKEIAKDLVDMMPSYRMKIEEYIEAEDPEAGIEEEYHPKNDTLYCWRTRRLMAAQHLHAFSAMIDGDIGKGLRKLEQLPNAAADQSGIVEDEEDLEAILQTVRAEAKPSRKRTLDMDLDTAQPPSSRASAGSRSKARNVGADGGRVGEAEEGEEVE